ncbi:MAG: hypothetical protein K2G70_01035 [Turicibacter sp.]|nr:hypothetical protein [Turicibacter sp.]
MKHLVYFMIGLAIGGIGGYYAGKKIEEKRSEKEVDQLKEYYDAKGRYVRDESRDAENDENTGETVENRSAGQLSNEKRKEIKEKLNQNWKETTNYAACYKGEEADADNEGEESPEMAANRFHDQNRNRPPELISETALDGVPKHFDQHLLYYYAFDESVTDEDELLIDEPGHLLGMVMEECGFIDNDVMQIYVINYQTDCVYEVNKIMASYCETHELVLSEKY